MTYGRDLLRKYLKDEDLSQVDFARQVSVTESMISHYLCEDPDRHRGPNIENAHAIERITKGKVPAISWIRSRRKARPGARRAA